MMTPCRARAFLAGLAFLAGALALIAAPPARAEGLQRFTGYANPGTPNDIVKPNGDIVSAADEPKAFGGSIYYMILNRTEGLGNDTWGAHIKDFDAQFQPGVDDALKPSPGLDKTARYLYLYQIVNDRGSKSPIDQATLRLVIDPALITSWGYFGAAHGKDNKPAPGAGVGFATEADAKLKEAIVPISTQHPVGPIKRPFVENAPPKTAANPYQMSAIKTNNPVKAIAEDPQAENTGRAPVTVVLMKSADFRGAPTIHTQGRLMTADANQIRDAAAVANTPLDYAGFGPFAQAFNPMGMANMPGMPSPTAPALEPVVFANPGDDGLPDSNHSPAIRALFYDVEGDIPVRQNERSVLFGFTSNFPPTYEAARLNGSPFQKEVGVAEAGPAEPGGLHVDVECLPTPVAFQQLVPCTGIGTVAGTLGGGETVSFPALGTAGVAGFSGIGTGATGAGNTGGTGNGQQAQQQQQQPTPTPTPVSVVNNNSAVAIAVQQQQQKQQQQQQQQQTNNNTPGNVVPEPASLASALLGVPFLFLFIRRKKPATV